MKRARPVTILVVFIFSGVIIFGLIDFFFEGAIGGGSGSVGNGSVDGGEWSSGSSPFRDPSSSGTSVISLVDVDKWLGTSSYPPSPTCSDIVNVDE